MSFCDGALWAEYYVSKIQTYNEVRKDPFRLTPATLEQVWKQLCQFDTSSIDKICFRPLDLFFKESSHFGRLMYLLEHVSCLQDYGNLILSQSWELLWAEAKYLQEELGIEVLLGSS
jgi:hypothetical protein